MGPGGKIAAQGEPSEIVTVELVENVFGLPCRVIADPETATPLIVPARRKRTSLRGTLTGVAGV
jgi:iron complex transport system ATP-binding protein